MANRTTLKTKKDGTILYPETVADIVYTLDSDATGKKLTVEQKLQNIENKLSEVEQAKDYKGYFPNVDALLAKYPNGDHPERAGWYARVGESGTSDTTMYYWDLEDDAWVKGAIVNVTGASTVNGVEPDSEGNITLTAENVPTAFTTEQGTNKSVQEVFNDLQLEHNQLEDEIEVLQNKTSVLYLTNSQFEDAINRLVEPYANGQVAVANDDGDYKIGSSYKFVIEGTEDNPVFRWEEITSSGGTEITDTLTLTKEVFIPELQSTITYENVSTPYGFAEDAEGYWTSTNKTNTYTHAVLKININLNRPANLRFDYEQSGSYLNYNYGEFGLINAELDNDNYLDAHLIKANLYGQKSGSVVYKNFPAGSNFIYVKYIRGAYSNAHDLKFKLTIQNENSEEYTSSGEIKVNDNNNLQIEDSNIVTENKLIAKTLKGTLVNPIILEKLPSGLYSLSGYFKWVCENVNTFSVLKLTEDSPDFVIIGVSDNLKAGKSYGKATKTITAYNCGMSNSTVISDSSSLVTSARFKTFNFASENVYTWGTVEYSIITTNGTNFVGNIILETDAQNDYSFNFMFIPNKKPISFYEYNYNNKKLPNSDIFLDIRNSWEYEPIDAYNPATKKYVDDKIAENQPITLVNDIEESTNPETENKIIKLNNISDKSLYYIKKGEPITEPLEKEKAYSKLVFNKNIVDEYISDELAEKLLWTASLQPSKINVNGSISMNQNQWFYIQFETENNRVSKIYSVCVTYNNGNTPVTVFYENGQWLKDYIEVTDLGPASSVSSYTHVSIRFNDSIALINDNSLIFAAQDTYENVRLANYEDLANAGGGSGSKPITKFENPSSSELDLKYDDTFGTSKDLNNQELYYYKQVDVANFFSPLHFQDAEYYDVFIEKSVTNERVYDAEDKDISVTLCSLRLSDAESNSIGNISLVLTTNSDGMISSISIPEVGEDIYTINNGWVNVTDEKYFRLKEYIISKPQFSNVKTFYTEENMNSDEHFAIYLLYETYFYGTISENVEELLPIRLALYRDVAGIQQSADYKGDFESGRWYNRGDIVSGVGEGIFYVCLTENNGEVQPEYFNEYTEQDGIRYWQNMNYNTYISLNAMTAQSDGVGRNIADTYATKEELENAVIAGGGTPLPSEMVKYYEEYDPSKTYSKNDMIYYANHFFISVSDNNTGNTPNINMFYTMIGDNLYWRNMGYSATYADNATNDGDGNNISNTYVHNTRTINNKPLTSNVTLTGEDINVKLQAIDEEFNITANEALYVISDTLIGLDEKTNNIQSSLGTQCTFTLSGTTLTITPK